MTKNLDLLLYEAQVKLLGLYKTANAGHIGASLSCLQILIFIVQKLMVQKEDKLILSKGHAAGALYTVLDQANKLSGQDLSQFYKNGTQLAAHPPCSRAIEAIPFGTGSLGHGLGLAVGLALSTRYNGKKNKVFVVLSDGELNEGSTWEAVMFAAHMKISNLYVFVDKNGLQGIGKTEEVINLTNLAEKFSMFGWDVSTSSKGNNFVDLDFALSALRHEEKPKIIICNTIKGCGVSYMEDKVEWHYLPMNDMQYDQALKEVKVTYEKTVFNLA